MELDKTDRKILALIQQDASMSASEIAEQVNLSQPPCWRRIKRLEEAGFIQKRAGILNRNRPTAGASGAMPFGGPGLSGNFRPGAYYAADYCAWPQASQVSPAAARMSAQGFPE